MRVLQRHPHFMNHSLIFLILHTLLTLHVVDATTSKEWFLEDSHQVLCSCCWNKRWKVLWFRRFNLNFKLRYFVDGNEENGIDTPARKIDNERKRNKEELVAWHEAYQNNRNWKCWNATSNRLADTLQWISFSTSLIGIAVQLSETNFSPLLQKIIITMTRHDIGLWSRKVENVTSTAKKMLMMRKKVEWN